MTTLPTTFWAKTAQSDCIIWTGAVNSKGYPCFGVNGVSQLAHRLAYEDAHGPIPDGMTVDHTCRVRNCVRLDHVELVTSAENSRRARVASGYHIGGECGRGHRLTTDSTVVSTRGRLLCRQCGIEDGESARRRAALASGEIPAGVIREWAMGRGIAVSQRGRLPESLRRAYREQVAS